VSQLKTTGHLPHLSIGDVDAKIYITKWTASNLANKSVFSID